MAAVIGIIYDRDENWIAGSYYVENLISALGVSQKEKPVFKIYCSKLADFEQLRATTHYPNMTWVELRNRNNFLDRIFNKISYTFFRTHWVVRGIDSKVDLLFPGSDSFFFEKIRRKLFWIPDFQDKHYPEFFSAAELSKRNAFYNKLVQNRWPIVFSSQNASLDFKNLYPNAFNKTFLLPFAVTLPSLLGIHIKSLKDKFRIIGDYFICSNQFWAHKNHIVVLKATLELRKKKPDVCVVFTGKPYDNRNPKYYEVLMDFVNMNKMHNNILFLGFIDRKEQLVLMKNSLAIIQPSLFEGWSTVVEDAKALTHSIIVSDIPVHREQLGQKFEYYFAPHDHLVLSELMERVSQEPQSNSDNYNRNVLEFGDKAWRIFKQTI